MTDSLRTAGPADLDALVEIENAVFVPPAYEPMSRRQFRWHISNPRAALIVCTRRGQVVGYALGLARAGSRYMRFYSLAVLSQAQGGEIGKRLFEAIETAARQRGLGVITEVRADNTRLHRRYLGLGYTEFEHKPDYYPDGCAAIRMKRSFGEV
ncbi:GNAT family N-acetyltransferase [Microbaculum marinisediminis]|uniref:GNAT family N-acetyltransferase n=1 Tax=Microbaculum marinisediminis TaxID=2931392 RepID=A0AAW5QUN0_9HYPH|nr:GNAT family N-acetyltransferase [Microbaculum sp. A6E488]MCT8971582.1 GNAT family N-acetyltransferase [Microbaculum sp. A6E488]